jgi:predicted protein tyrosine phosphatase
MEDASLRGALTDAEPTLRWVNVRAGRLALTHRPKLRGMPSLRAEGCTRLATLLSAREGATRIGELAREAGLAWTWLPLENARPPTGDVAWRQVAQGLSALAESLDAGEAIALHCSAGIHRTGMIAYALLRTLGDTPAQALDRIERMRPITRAGMTRERQGFGDAIAEWLAREEPRL